MSETKSVNRSAKLRTLFSSVLTGKSSITNSNAKLFLEAVVDQTDPSVCIQRLAGSANGFAALQSALSSSNTPAFLNDTIAKFIIYLEAPPLKTVCGGEVLRQVVMKFVELPVIWDSLIKYVKAGTLDDCAVEAFSWLLLQLLCLPKDIALTYIPIAQDEKIQKLLKESAQSAVRQRTQRHKLLTWS
jgi:hypothetical protein